MKSFQSYFKKQPNPLLNGEINRQTSYASLSKELHGKSSKCVRGREVEGKKAFADVRVAMQKQTFWRWSESQT